MQRSICIRQLGFHGLKVVDFIMLLLILLPARVTLPTYSLMNATGFSSGNNVISSYAPVDILLTIYFRLFFYCSFVIVRSFL